MSIASELNRIRGNVAKTYTALEQMGATLPETQNTDGLEAAVQSIPTGSSDAVLYTEQTLTEEQKTQARKNIGVEELSHTVIEPDTHNSRQFLYLTKSGSSYELTLDETCVFNEEKGITIQNIPFNDTPFFEETDVVCFDASVWFEYNEETWSWSEGRMVPTEDGTWGDYFRGDICAVLRGQWDSALAEKLSDEGVTLFIYAGPFDEYTQAGVSIKCAFIPRVRTGGDVLSVHENIVYTNLDGNTASISPYGSTTCFNVHSPEEITDPDGVKWYKYQCPNISMSIQTAVFYDAYGSHYCDFISRQFEKSNSFRDGGRRWFEHESDETPVVLIGQADISRPYSPSTDSWFLYVRTDWWWVNKVGTEFDCSVWCGGQLERTMYSPVYKHVQDTIERTGFTETTVDGWLPERHIGMASFGDTHIKIAISDFSMDASQFVISQKSDSTSELYRVLSSCSNVKVTYEASDGSVTLDGGVASISEDYAPYRVFLSDDAGMMIAYDCEVDFETFEVAEAPGTVTVSIFAEMTISADAYVDIVGISEHDTEIILPHPFVCYDAENRLVCASGRNSYILTVGEHSTVQYNNAEWYQWDLGKKDLYVPGAGSILHFARINNIHDETTLMLEEGNSIDGTYRWNRPGDSSYCVVVGTTAPDWETKTENTCVYVRSDFAASPYRLWTVTVLTQCAIIPIWAETGAIQLRSSSANTTKTHKIVASDDAVHIPCALTVGEDKQTVATKTYVDAAIKESLVVPSLTIGTVDTLDPGSSATASITGTAEEPVLNLGIPKGESGSSEQVKYVKPATVPMKSGQQLIIYGAEGGDVTIKLGTASYTYHLDNNTSVFWGLWMKTGDIDGSFILPAGTRRYMYAEIELGDVQTFELSYSSSKSVVVIVI